MSVFCGIHLMPVAGTPDPRRPSCIAALERDGRLIDLVLAASDDEILAAIPPDTSAIAIDAPLVVANARGQRPVEHVLAWLDQPAFPNSVDRLTRLYGGLRGVRLRDPLRMRAAEVVEALPDLVLRELEWERRHPASDTALPLDEYRTLWLGVRPPRYRPKGLGRAVASGRAAAAALLAEVIDLNHWHPTRDPGDWQAIADAAQLDAMACAYLAWRRATSPALTVRVGDADTPMVLPADANLRSRAALHMARIAAAQGAAPGGA